MLMSRTHNNVTDYLNKTLPGSVKSSSLAYRHEVLTIEAAKIRDVVLILKKELGFDLLLDVSAIDWSKHPDKKPARFEIDYFFQSVKNSERVQLKVFVDNADDPEIDSITDIFPSANWAERECWDMMGIKFKGHPNLKRLLMWKEFMGYPLRKDYPLNRRQPLPVQEDVL